MIYDGAHAFGCQCGGKSLLSYGDISTCSFHATKVFHTVEGGCIVTNDDATARVLMLYRQFGHVDDEYFSIGLNGKNSEFHAAMGLAVLKHFPEIQKQRQSQWEKYKTLLGDFLTLPAGDFTYNYSIRTLVTFRSEEVLLNCMDALKKVNVIPRRYFYPSLNQLPYLEHKSCPLSEDISNRTLAFPLFDELSHEDQSMIARVVTPFLKQ